MAFLIAMLATAACKKSERAKPAEPHASPFTPLAAAAPPALDGADEKPAFPQEAPVVVIWRGSGGDTPSTELSLRIWKGGRVRYTCGRGGTLPPERVAAISDGFVQAGWKPAAPDAPRADPQPPCKTTSVQLMRDGMVERRDSGCDRVRDDIQDAVDFVLAALGPRPC